MPNIKIPGADQTYEYEGNLKVDGTLEVDGILSGDGGVASLFGGGTDLTATPTAAEFDAIFGAAAKAKAGFVGVAEDTSDGKNYLVISDGTTWHYAALTPAS